MIDYKNELGVVLEKVNRGYIMDFRGDWRDSKSQESKFEPVGGRWVISADGLNYLDLH